MTTTPRETTAQALSRRLRAYAGLYNHISKRTGISLAHVTRIARGESSPTVDMADKLIPWLDEADKISAAYEANRQQPGA